MIECNDLNVKIKDNTLLTGDASFHEGVLTVITGNSGSGKTTLLNIIAGLDKSQEDKIIYKDSMNHMIKAEASDIGYVFQDSSMLEDLTIEENMEFYRSISKKESMFTLSQCLEMVHLHILPDKKISEISGGQRQRLAIAACLYKNVHYLFLDEPTAYLDNTNSEDIISLLYELTHRLNLVTVVSSHDYRFKERADVIYEISDKEIHLIKESNIPEQENNISQTKKIKKNPVWYYAKNSFKNNLKKESIFNIAISVLIAITALFLGYMSAFNNIENKQLNDLTRHELKISLKNELNKSSYRSFTENTIDHNTISLLKQIQYVENVYPFYEFTAQVNGKEILVQSYYNNEMMNSNSEELVSQETNCKVNGKEENTGGYIYSSASLEKLAYSNMNITLNLLSGTGEVYPVEISLKCNEILERTYQNQYSSNGENILYVPYSFIENLYNNLYIENSQKDSFKYHPALYLVYFDDMKNIKTIMNGIKNIDSDICCFSETDLDEILKLSNNMIHMKKTTFYILLAIVLVIGWYYHFTKFYNKISEYALIRANGLSKLQTVLCSLETDALTYGISVLFIGIVLILIDTLMKIITASILLYQMLITIAIMLIFLAVEFVFEMFYMHFHTVKNMIRD